MASMGSLSGRNVALLLLVVMGAGCAAAPAGSLRTMQPGDLKLVAGHWTGSAYAQQARALSIEAVINEDGSFWTAERRPGATQVPGQMKIVDGGVVYQTAESEGKMTFHETDTTWIWRWQGATRIGDRKVTNELTKS